MKVKMNKVSPTMVKNIWHFHDLISEKCLIKVSSNRIESGDTEIV
jgi:hypothetical protein